MISAFFLDLFPNHNEFLLLIQKNNNNEKEGGLCEWVEIEINLCSFGQKLTKYINHKKEIRIHCT